MLYLFGDSYCTYNPHQWTAEQGLIPGRQTIDHPSWWEIVSSELGCDFQLFSMSGTSTEWLARQWLTVQDQIRAEDWVILVQTDSARLWCYEQMPDRTSISAQTQHPTEPISGWRSMLRVEPERVRITSRQRTDQGLEPIDPRWVERHWLDPHWQHKARDLQQLLSQSVESHPAKSLIIPAFSSCDSRAYTQGVRGSLYESVSCREFQQWSPRSNWDDRLAHISECNHPVLARKVLEWFCEGRAPDLTEGFFAGFKAST